MQQKGATFLLCIFFAVLSVVTKFSIGVDGARLPQQNFNITQRFGYRLFPNLGTSSRYTIGQDVRIAVTVKDPDVIRRSRFNRTMGGEVRLRIIAAFNNRTSSTGAGMYPAQCNSSTASVWAEFGELGASKFFVFGRDLVRTATATFNVPPFPFRVCIKYTPHSDLLFRPTDRTYMGQWANANEYSKGRTVHFVNESVVYYYAPDTTLNEGDYVGIGIVGRSTAFYAQTVAPSAFPLRGDSVKLVPAGYPCTYERRRSTDNFTSNDYCGSNNVYGFRDGHGNVAGSWIRGHCPLEGSVASGVGLVGTNLRNPFVDTLTTREYPRKLTKNETMVAYFKLPAAGQYDVCYSPLAYRAAVRAQYETTTSPVWFKLMRNNVSCATDNHLTYVNYRRCAPNRIARLVVSPAGTSTPRWSMPYAPVGLQWVTVKVSGTNLNTNPALTWDMFCTSGVCDKFREFYNTQGGDVFRLVPASAFQATTAATTSGLFSKSTAFQRARFLVKGAKGSLYGGETLQVEMDDAPDLGTTAASAGCWYSKGDNYGTSRGLHLVYPQLCTFTATCSESGNAGPTASMDLGGEPHRGALASYFNETNQTAAYAYLRLPASGQYYVCYRKAGRAAWQALPWDPNVTVPSSLISNTSVNASSFIISPSSLNLNFTYSLNDTRATTQGQFVVKSTSTSSKLTTLPWNFYNTNITDATTVGSTLRLVPFNLGCDTRYPLVESTNAGLAECITLTARASCVEGRVCAGCLGRLDDSTTLRTSVVFYINIPYIAPGSGYTTLRVCYRYLAGPWIELPSTSVVSNPRRFLPSPPPYFKYTLNDRSIGSWARINFYSTNGLSTIDTAAYTGTRGTLLRLVQNRTTCDVTWTGTGNVSDYNSTYIVSDLGSGCLQTTSSSGTCNGRNVNPTSGGVNGSFPYFDIDSRDNTQYRPYAVGFITLPAAPTNGGVGYRLCVKQANRNWFDLTPAVRPVSPSVNVVMGSDSATRTYVAGSYDYVTLQTTVSTATIDVTRVMAKLVASADRCDRPAVGTQGPGRKYVSFTIATAYGSFVTLASNPGALTGKANVVRAYMTFPTTNVTEFAGTTSYRVCYNPTKSAATNWVDLGLVSVMSPGIGWTTNVAPNTAASVVVTIKSSGTQTLNTTKGGDAFKLVPLGSVCTSSSLLPGNQSTAHVGLTGSYLNVNTSTIDTTLGITDLGPTDLASTTLATASDVLPYSAATQSYKVCYYSYSIGRWFEIEEVSAPYRLKVISTGGGFIATPPTAKTISVASYLMAQTPSSTAVYGYQNRSFPTLVVAGVVTTFNTQSISLTASSTNYYGFSVSGSSLTTADKLTIVQLATETSSAGVLSATGTLTCGAGNVVSTILADSTSTSVQTTFTFTMPLTPGLYLFCYAPANSPNVQLVLPADGTSSNFTNPTFVVSPRVFASISATTTSATISVKDLPLFTPLSGGSVSPVDMVYFVNASTSLCGISTSPNGTVPATAASTLVPSTGNITYGAVYSVLSVVKATTLVLSLPRGTFTLCYYKAWMNSTVLGLSTVQPVLQSSNWYAIPVVVNAVSQQFYQTGSGPVKLWAQCVKNATSGVPFTVNVYALDALNAVTAQTSRIPLRITADTSTGATWSFVNTGGTCSPTTSTTYSEASSNPTISTATGSATFTFTPVSGCGTSSSAQCRLRFTSPGLTTSNECVFRIPWLTVSKFTAASTNPTSCYVGSPCVFTIQALGADGSFVYTFSSTSTVSLTASTGLLMQVNGVTGSTIVSFVNGALTLTVTPVIDPSTVSAWPESVATVPITISVVNGTGVVGPSASIAFVVVRPTLAQLAIVDVTQANWDGTDANSVDINRYPSWEPTTTFSSFWNGNVTVTSLASASIPLVSGQYYNLKLIALDSRGVVLPSVALIPSSATISITFANTAATSGNVIIGAPSTLASSYGYVVPLSTTLFTSVRPSVLFRLKTSTGCTSALGGCTLSVGVANHPSVVTTLKTVVRSPASRLVATCQSTSGTNKSTTTCPPSTVENGVSVTLTVTDGFGNVDESFTGTAYATIGVPVGAATYPASLIPTRVSSLVSGTTWTGVTFTAGVATISDFTLSQPCPYSSCNVTFYTDWGAGYATLSLTTAKSTVGMSCVLNTSRVYYVLNSGYTAVTATYSAGLIAQVSNLLIYPDTDLCFTVTAINPSSARTLYESIWVHWRGRSASTGVTFTPSTFSNYRYRFMTRSQVEFCLRVGGQEGATFALDFFAQSFGSNWASGTAGTCTTPTFRISTRRFIAKLKVTSTTGLTEIAGFTSPSTSTVWGYSQLTTVSSTLTPLIGFGLVDHYGNDIAASNVAASQVNYALTVGGCLPSDMTLNQCVQGTTGRVLSFTTPFAVAESGMLSASITGSQTSVVSASGLAVQLQLSQWCLACTLSFSISTASGVFVDGAFGAVTNNVRFSVLIPTSVPTYVAFRYGNSPMMPPSFDRSGLLRSYWPYFVNSSGARPSTVGSTPVLIHKDCFNVGSSCQVPDTLFSHAYCTSDSPTAISGNGAPLRFFVVRSVVPPRYGEPYCTGSCAYTDTAMQGQADIFNSYTLTVSIGTQQLLCTDSWCPGQGTTAVSRSITAAGTTIPTALIATFNQGLAAASFQLVGLNNSVGYQQDSTSKLVPLGTVPSVAGALQVAATGASTAPVTLTSSLTGTDEAGTYYLVWRGPQPITGFAVRSAARPAECVNGSTYSIFTAPTSPLSTLTYSGYPQQASLSSINFAYASSRIAVGVAFPITLELRDAFGLVSPNTKGSITTSLYSWVGCGFAGTITVVGADTTNTLPITNGRLTLWVSFSAPCQACRLSFAVTADSTQTFYFGQLAYDDLQRIVVSDPINIVDFVSGSATTIYATNNYANQASTVGVEDLITFTAAAYANMGGFALADTTSTFEIAAYNQIQSVGSLLWTVGNGGILRPSNTFSSASSRHTVRNTGKGTVGLSFAFQRVCRSCLVVVAWTIISTGATGSFNLQTSSGTTFAVTSSSKFATIAGYAPGTVRKYTPFTVVAWTAVSTPTIALAGFDSSTVPSASTPTMTRVGTTSSTSSGGVLDASFNTTSSAAIFHLRTTASCDICQFTMGSVSKSIVVATVATHYRVESLTPSSVSLGSTVAVSVYASDASGDVDVTVGGQADCKYVDPMMCDQNALLLAVSASESGVVANDFSPTRSYITMGGPSASGFSITGNSLLYIVNGQTPSGAGIIVTGAPVVGCTPIVTDATGLSSSSYPTYDFSIDVGLTGLILSNDQPGSDAQIYTVFTVTVAFTKQFGGAGNRYIASGATNTIRVDPSGECNYILQHPSNYIKMVNGIATINFIFTSASVGGTCNPLFTSVTGNVACSGTTCVTQSSIRAYGVTATSWNFKYPSVFDNDYPKVGPRFAVAGRTQYVSPQLYQITSSATVEASVCKSTCVVSLTALSCSPSPTISPSGSAPFNTNGTASIAVSWPLLYSGSQSNATLVSYSCSLQGAATGGIDPPSVTTFTVQVCNPAKLVLATNASSSSWASGLLETGVSYPLDASIVDASGVLCQGDTQYGVSTLLTVSVVNADGSAVKGISVVNINTTTSTPPSASTLQPYNNTVYLAGGRFRFQLVFTSDTRSLNLTKGIRVRVTGVSKAPVLNFVAYTPIVRVRQSYYTAQWSNPPSSVYVSRSRNYSLNLVATNAIPAAWLTAQNLSTPVGTSVSARFLLNIDPAFRQVRQVNLVGTFNAAGEYVLTNGTATATFSFNSLAQDGNFTASIAQPQNSLNPSLVNLPTAISMILQTPVAYSFLSVQFRSGAPHSCYTSCTLPSTAFTQTTTNSSTVLNTTQGLKFSFAVYVADPYGIPVYGETDIVIGCSVVSTKSSSSVTLAAAPSLTRTGVITAKVVNGYANFSVGMLNSVGSNASLPASGLLSELVTLQCGCVSGLCPSVPTAVSLPISVQGFNITQDMRAALKNHLIIKVPSSATTISAVPVVDIRTKLLASLTAAGITFIDSDNVNSTLVITACLVNRDYFGFADLRGTVCGPTHACVTDLTNTCPSQVVQCSCTDYASNTYSPGALSAAREARLFRARQLAGQNVQVEIAVSLENCPALQLVSAAQIDATYVNLQQLIVTALSGTTFSQYSFVSDTILTVRTTTSVVTAPPPPSTLPPLTPSPPNNQTRSISSAISLSGALALLLTVVALMLAM